MIIGGYTCEAKAVSYRVGSIVVLSQNQRIYTTAVGAIEAIGIVRATPLLMGSCVCGRVKTQLDTPVRLWWFCTDKRYKALHDMLILSELGSRQSRGALATVGESTSLSALPKFQTG